MYPATFDKPDVHAAMLRFCDACEKAGMTSTEVSLRWLMHHSELGDGDALILGASRYDPASFLNVSVVGDIQA